VLLVGHGVHNLERVAKIKLPPSRAAAMSRQFTDFRTMGQIKAELAAHFATSPKAIPRWSSHFVTRLARFSSVAANDGWGKHIIARPDSCARFNR
jgi:hypothetical protein